MSSLLNEKFGYLLATLQRDVEPENVVPHSASFDDIKDMFGNLPLLHTFACSTSVLKVINFDVCM